METQHKLDRSLDFSHVGDHRLLRVLQADWRTFKPVDISYAVDETLKSALLEASRFQPDLPHELSQARWEYATRASGAFKRGDTLACLANLQLYWST